jgi:hypothetical protein
LPYFQSFAPGFRTERILTYLAGAEGFEPPSSVLETDSLTVELTPLKNSCQQPAASLQNQDLQETCRQLFAASCSLKAALLRFLVRLVLAAAVTELRELETARGRLLVLRRRVIALLARSALQCNDFPHIHSFQQSALQYAGTSPFRLG